MRGPDYNAMNRYYAVVEAVVAKKDATGDTLCFWRGGDYWNITRPKASDGSFHTLVLCPDGPNDHQHPPQGKRVQITYPQIHGDKDALLEFLDQQKFLKKLRVV